MPLLSSLAIPLHGFHEVLRHAVALVVAEAEQELSIGVSLLGFGFCCKKPLSRYFILLGVGAWAEQAKREEQGGEESFNGREAGSDAGAESMRQRAPALRQRSVAATPARAGQGRQTSWRSPSAVRRLSPPFAGSRCAASLRAARTQKRAGIGSFGSVEEAITEVDGV